MSTEEKQDTINVELPIEAVGAHRVRAAGVELIRSEWRAASSGEGTWTSTARYLAPAVVAWIERDEWEPLDLPEVGRKIKATLRNGRVETFKVGKVDVASAWASVWKADSSGEVRFIQRACDAANPGPADIIAWEYVDEPAESEPEDTHTVTVSLQADLSGFADSLQAAADAIRAASK